MFDTQGIDNQATTVVLHWVNRILAISSRGGMHFMACISNR